MVRRRNHAKRKRRHSQRGKEHSTAAHCHEVGIVLDRTKLTHEQYCEMLATPKGLVVSFTVTYNTSINKCFRSLCSFRVSKPLLKGS